MSVLSAWEWGTGIGAGSWFSFEGSMGGETMVGRAAGLGLSDELGFEEEEERAAESFWSWSREDDML